MDDEVIIISVETGEAVRNVGDLRANIAAYKDTLNGLDIGSKEYADTLNALQINQAALKDAMHATTAEGDAQGKTMEQIAKDAMGLGTSYNSLVRQMAQLDQQFRAEEDSVKRAALGAEIKNINAQLKELDEARGKYGRNVGNYKSAIEGLGGAFKATAGSAAGLINPIQKGTQALKVMSATPAIAILGVLANVVTKVSDGLKSSEKNTMAMKQALSVFQPIINATTNAVQKLGEWLVKVVEWAGKAARWLGIVKGDSADFMANLVKAENQLILDKREMGLYEAQVEAKIAQLQADAANKTQYSAAQRKQFTDEAKRLSEELFEKQYELAQREVELIEQRNSLTGNAAAANEKLIQAKIRLADLDKQRAQRERSIQRQENGAVSELNKQTKALHEEATAAIEDDVEAAEAAAQDYLDSVGNVKSGSEELFQQIVEMDDARIAERERTAAAERAVEEANQQYFDEQLQRERERNQQRISIALQYAGAVGSIAGSLADIYEQNAENDEAAAAKGKALQIAAATIQTIGGAVSAFMSTWNAKEIPMTAKMVLAPLNAASVLAAGYAQIRSMTSVKMGKGGSGAANTPAVVSAPSGGSSSIQQVRTITGAAEEDRLNKMASNQRVILVYSDIEAADNARRVQVNETTF